MIVIDSYRPLLRNEAMPDRSRWQILLLAVAALGACQRSGLEPRATAAVMDLRSWDFERDGPVSLQGEWEFYWKRLVKPGTTPAQVAADVNVGRPVLVEAPGTFASHRSGALAFPNFGFASYRLTVLTGPLQAPLLLRVDPGSSAARLFWNGKPVGGFGVVATDKASAKPGRSVHWIELEPAVRNELLIHVSNYHHPRGSLGALRLVSLAGGADHRDARRALDAFLLGSVLMMGIYHLFVFLARRRFGAALWFGLFCMLLGSRMAMTNEALMASLVDYSVAVRFEYLGWYGAVLLFLLFMHELFPQDQQKHIFWTLVAICIPFVLAVLFTDVLWFAYPNTEFQWFTLAGGAYCLGVIGSAVWHRRAGARLTLFGWGFLFATVIIDIRAPGSISWAPIFVTPLGLLVFVLTQAGVLARVFARAFAQGEQLTAELERTNTVKDQFLANLSHELNTPLTTIYGYAELLKESDLDELSKSAAASIHQSAGILSEQMNDLLLITRLESELAAAHSRLDLVATIRAGLGTLLPLAETHHVSIVDRMAGEVFVLGSATQLRAAFRNIVRNGILFNKPQGTIEVDCHLDQKAVVVRIKDTGVGIAPDVMPRIFERFYRADQTDHYAVSGVGLGLYVARQIIDGHHGKIEVSSELGRGTEVCVTLPLAV